MDTYEKKYKKALEKAKESYHRFEGKTVHYDLVKLDLEDMFPELKESEDERMKNQIINYFECQSRDEPSRKDIHNKWINYIKRKTLSKNDYAFLRDCARILKTFGYCSHANKLFNLCPELGESIKEMMSAPIVSEEIEDERIRKHLLKHFQNKTKQEWNGMPTKNIIAWFVKQGEQKPIDYNKELKKCRENPLYFFDKYVKLKLKKPAWSEEDEKFIKEIEESLLAYKIIVMDNDIELAKEIEKEIDWLKSLKDRVQPQNIAYYNPYKEVVESIVEMCKHYDKASHSGLRDFYDNVKVKCKDAKEYDSLFPQNTWKPSDELIQALERSADYLHDYGKNDDDLLLLRLLEELKKLKKE